MVKVPNSGYSTLTFYLGTHIWIVSLVLHRIQEEPWRQRVVEVHRCLHIKPFCLLVFHSQILLLLYHVHLHLRHFILNLTKCIRKPVLLNPLEFKFVATWDNIHLKPPIHSLCLSWSKRNSDNPLCSFNSRWCSSNCLLNGNKLHSQRWTWWWWCGWWCKDVWLYQWTMRVIRRIQTQLWNLWTNVKNDLLGQNWREPYFWTCSFGTWSREFCAWTSEFHWQGWCYNGPWLSWSISSQCVLQNSIVPNSSNLLSDCRWIHFGSATSQISWTACAPNHCLFHV